MKNNLIIIFLILSEICFGQNLVFTNQNLKTYLLNEYCVDSNGDDNGDTTLNLNNDNEIQFTEANSIQSLIIGSPESAIISLYDLHQFTNLKRLTIWGDFGLVEISNLNLDSLQHIRISDHNSITDIDLSDLPNLNSIFIEGLSGLNSLNIQNGSYATNNFSLFYTYFNYACVDSIAAEYNSVAQHIITGGTPDIICTLGINEQQKEQVLIYPNPSIDEIRIETDLIISKINIYNMSGKLVYEGFESNNIINIKDFKAGGYLLIIETKNGVNIKHKLIIE